MAMLILNRCVEGKAHDTKPYPGTVYIPGVFRVRVFPTTPNHPHAESPINELDVSNADMTAIDTVSVVLFLLTMIRLKRCTYLKSLNLMKRWLVH
jgi:hypothetical protein